jgi:hypothetical protein
VSPLEAAERLEQFGADLEAAAVRGVDRTLQKAEARAHELSQGTRSLAELAQAGHPYAIRHLFATAGGDAPLAAGVINRQGGQFDAGWTIVPPQAGPDDVTGDLYNADEPVATYLEEGTRYMWARPVNHVIGVEMEPVLRQEVGDEVDRALRRAAGE